MAQKQKGVADAVIQATTLITFCTQPPRPEAQPKSAAPRGGDTPRFGRKAGPAPAPDSC
jgi:hypothetical protein